MHGHKHLWNIQVVTSRRTSDNQTPPNKIAILPRTLRGDLNTTERQLELNNSVHVQGSTTDILARERERDVGKWKDTKRNQSKAREARTDHVAFNNIAPYSILFILSETIMNSTPNPQI